MRFIVVNLLAGYFVVSSLGCRTQEMRIDLGAGETMEFVFVQALDIYVGKHEVTNGAYRRFRPAHDSGSYEGWTLDLNCQPAVQVSLDDARAFCYWIQGGGWIPVGYQARLPSGPEWTSIARCDGDGAHPRRADWPPLYGNFADETAERILGWAGHSIEGYDDGAAVTCPVPESGENKCGLFGLAGNVWEWTEEPARDGSWRVLRGGSWRHQREDQLRTDYREKHGAPWGKDNSVGFRVVLSH